MTQPVLNETVAQIGIVVRDIEAAAMAWAEMLAVPVPEIITTDPVDRAKTEYEGEASTVRAKQAFLPMGNLQIELIEPVGGPSTWRDQLDRHGGGLHHIAFRVEGMRDTVASLDAQGMPLIQRGEFTGGRYAYIDGTKRLGAILELLEHD